MYLYLDAFGPRGFAARLPRVDTRAEFDHNLAMLRRVLGFRWEKRSKLWVSDGPDVLLDIERFSIQIVPTDAAIDRIRAYTARLQQITELQSAPFPDQQYGYQLVGTELLKLQERAILADDLGLGKTKQSIDAFLSLWPCNVLVVALKTKLYDWQEEIARWSNGSVRADVLPTVPKERKAFWDHWDGDVVIVNYEKLTLADWPFNIRWDAVLIDEATYVKNPRAQRSRALKRVCERATLVYPITGTPIETRVEDLYGLFTIARPSLFGSFARFRDEFLMTDYLGVVQGVRPDRQELLHERIAPWIVRRKKSEVQKQLPPKIYTVERIELSATERDEYRELLLNFDAWVEEQGRDLTEANVLTQLLRLQQYTSSPKLLDPEWDHGTKLAVLRGIVDEWDGQVLIFSRFATMVDYLRTALATHPNAFISGAVGSARERTERIKRFNAGEYGKVLLSTDAGAHGLNIQSADLIIHYDTLWNPARLRQREDRLHRIGQTKTVNVVSLIAVETIDEGMFGVASQRAEFADSVYEGARRALDYKRIARGDVRERKG